MPGSDSGTGADRAAVGEPERRPRPVALLLAGHGAQRAGMATTLYGWEPAFTEAMDEVFDCLGRVGERIRADWLAEAPTRPIDDASRAHPLLFGIGYAVGRMLESWHVPISVVLGHSTGELAAAVLADVMDLRSAARLLVRRIRLFAQAPSGGMYAVAADAETLAPFLRGGVVIGAYNGPRQILLSGPEPELGEVVSELERAGIICRSARAERGFHSPSLAPACTRSLPWFETLLLRRPRMAMISGVLGVPLAPELAADPGYWALQPARPVRFGPALDTLVAAGDFVLVDGGPSRWVSAMARRHPAVSSGASALTALLGPRRAAPEADRPSARAAAELLRREGYPVPDTTPGPRPTPPSAADGPGTAA